MQLLKNFRGVGKNVSLVIRSHPFVGTNITSIDMVHAKKNYSVENLLSVFLFRNIILHNIDDISRNILK